MNASYLCILNCVEDAIDFLQARRRVEAAWTIVSSHCSVNDFLSVRGIDCHHLSSYISDQSLTSFFEDAGASVSSFLRHLDGQLAGKISHVLNVGPMNYFYPLYVYLGKYECLNMLKLKCALGVLCREKRFDRVFVYESAASSYLGDGDLPDLVKRFSGLPVDVRRARSSRSRFIKKAIAQAASRARNALGDPSQAISRLHTLISQRFSTTIDVDRQSFLLLEPLYDLSFLKHELPEYNTVVWPYESLPRIRGISYHPDRAAASRITSLIDSLDHTQLQNSIAPDLAAFPTIVLRHFLRNLEKNIAAVQWLDHLHKRLPVSLAVWGNSPAWGARSLLVEYLLRAGVPVIGMQHGGSYVVQQCSSVHLDSDFERCTHYLSYGFDGGDIRKTYPRNTVACQVIPVGSYRELVEKKQRMAASKDRQPIDVLFPIAESLSFFREAFRIRASELSRYQDELTTFLDGLAGIVVGIKPVPNYDENTCASIEKFKNLRNARLLRHMKLTRCLRRFKVKAVVIEYPSTPLFEVLGEDCEIFLLSDPILPFHAEALDLLKKRVHYFDTIESLKSSLCAYLQGKVASLRNDEFYHKYVAREETKQLILTTLATIAREGTGCARGNQQCSN